MALSKQVSEFSTPSNEFEVESTLTVRPNLAVFVAHSDNATPYTNDSYQTLQKGLISYCIKEKTV